MSVLNEGNEETRRQATEMIRTGRYQEAIGLLQPLSAATPEDALVWRLLGMAQGSVGELGASVNSFQRAVTIAPDSPQNHYNLALALKGRGDLPLARKHVEKALALDPQYAPAQNLLPQLPAIAPPPAPAPPPPLAAPAPPALRPEAPPPSPYSSAYAPYTPYTPPGMNGQPLLGDRAYAFQSDVDAEMRKWSWDGFLWGIGGSWIWCWAHGGSSWGIGVLLAGMALGAMRAAQPHNSLAYIVSLLAHLGLGIYLGLKGNELSWSHRDFIDVEDFKACHRIWLWWWIGLTCVGIALAIGLYSIIPHR